MAAFQVSIGSSVFNASILNNPTASAFRDLLPLSLRMSDLNSNEKFADLHTTLPIAALDPGAIKAGDIMLYGSRTLVLWYEDYSSTYTYTRIGAVEDLEGLAETLGAGEIEVRFSTEASSAPDPTPTNNRASNVHASSKGQLLLVFLCILYMLIF